MPPTPEVADRLKADAAEALKLLENLSKPGSEEEKNAPKHVMPAASIRAAKGIAVSNTSKVGLVGSVSSGHGFVVVRLNDTMPYKWSGPMFYKSHSVGMGLNLGYSQVYTVLTMCNRDMAIKFANSELKWGNDFLVQNFNAMTGTVQGALGSEIQSMQIAEDSAMAFSISSGGIIDLSVTGWKTSPDDDKNAAVYGHAIVSPMAILSGDLPPPHEFAEFYHALNALAAKAAA